MYIILGGRGGGTGFQCIATHELGHALGMRHSDVSAAVMYAMVPCTGRISIELTDDDRKGIKVGHTEKTIITGETNLTNYY